MIGSEAFISPPEKPNRKTNISHFSIKSLPERRVVVTGGAGFLGAHLCERLVRCGFPVLCVDDFSTGRMENIKHLLSHPGFSLMRHDICLPFDTEASKIFNFACTASPYTHSNDPAATMKTPAATMKTNVMSTLNCLELARRNDATIIQASTSEHYGDPAYCFQPENDYSRIDAIDPPACQEEGGRCAEALFLDFARHHALRIKIGRIFNTYGPRMPSDDGRVVSSFIIQALTGKDITIYGTGEQTRSFCYVDDVIDGFMRLYAAPPHVTGPINLGNSAQCSILQLARLILHLTGSRSKIVHQPATPDGSQHRCPDISRARLELGWSPRISLEAGLVKTISYFDELLRRRASLIKTMSS